MKLMALRNLFPIIFLTTIIITTVLVYLPGLKGGFLFDDIPNLEQLGAYGGVTNFETFKSFVFNGISSPLGRPLALATFLLDDNNWPSTAEWFKTNNLKFHLVTGLLLCWATLNLLRLFGRPEPEAVWVAILSASIWLLHPYMVSTTLYVVQRMAQLAALFVFMGLTAYLHGRLLFVKGHSLRAYIWMSLSIVVATPLAVLSKENGILLPIMLLTIEFCLPKYKQKVALWWRVSFLWLPAAVIFYKLAKEINFAPDAWPNRPFNQPERLLTEGRILWEYLYNLYIPQIEGRGLFQDGYKFSRSILNPITTLPALCGLIALIVLAVKYREKYPLWSLAILFFFVSHLLESTVIALELYFEHRNYLSAGFLFLPIADALVSLNRKISPVLASLVVVVLLSLLTVMTWSRCNLWSDTARLQLYWAATTPESPRAQNHLASAMMDLGNVEGAIKQLKNATKTFPDNNLLAISLLIVELHNNSINDTEFRSALSGMENKSFDVQSVVGLRNLVTEIRFNPQPKYYAEDMLVLLEKLEVKKSFVSIHAFERVIPYLKGNLYVILKQYDAAYIEYDKAIKLYNDTDAALNMVAEMASANRPVEAMLLFNQAEKVYLAQNNSSLVRSRGVYDVEFRRMRGILEADLHGNGDVNKK